MTLQMKTLPRATFGTICTNTFHRLGPSLSVGWSMLFAAEQYSRTIMSLCFTAFFDKPRPCQAPFDSSHIICSSMTKISAFVTPCRTCGSASRKSLHYQQKAIWCSDPSGDEPRRNRTAHPSHGDMLTHIRDCVYTFVVANHSAKGYSHISFNQRVCMTSVGLQHVSNRVTFSSPRRWRTHPGISGCGAT
ncbi:hypothetical protein IQ06DRAFT_67201 [Phaeosphaeriaceae sp. SRC1lsM3a]|nr:hypothetical protein IQ06DRAFT_67201 [Stagonospora sp. SRC1lsM3a]